MDPSAAYNQTTGLCHHHTFSQSKPTISTGQSTIHVFNLAQVMKKIDKIMNHFFTTYILMPSDYFIVYTKYYVLTTNEANHPLDFLEN